MPSCKDDDPPAESGKSTQRAKCNLFHKYIHHNTIVCMLRGSCDLGPFATALPGLAPDGIGSVAYLQYTRALKWLFEMWYVPEIAAGALPLANLNQQNMSPNESLHSWWGSFMDPGITGSPCVSPVKILFTTSNKKWSFLDNHYLLGLRSRDCIHNFVQFHLKSLQKYNCRVVHLYLFSVCLLRISVLREILLPSRPGLGHAPRSRIPYPQTPLLC